MMKAIWLDWISRRSQATMRSAGRRTDFPILASLWNGMTAPG